MKLNVCSKTKREIPVDRIILGLHTLAHQRTINNAVGGCDDDNDPRTIYSLPNVHHYRPVMHIPQ
jgi:hypothetical protein